MKKNKNKIYKKAEAFLFSLYFYSAALALSTAHAAADFNVLFPLCDATINGKKMSCVIPQVNEVLSYDAHLEEWKPRFLNGISYQGVWDTNDNLITPSSAGDYYLVSVGGGVHGANYQVGDWAVFNGSTFDHVSNSNLPLSFKERIGAVSPADGDYSFEQLADVLIPFAPTVNQVLKYNGSKWIAADIMAVESIDNLPTCGANEVLTTDGTDVTCLLIPAAAVSSVNTQTEEVELTTDHIAEGSSGNNLYYKNSNVLSTLLSAPTLTNSPIQAGESLMVSLGKLQGQVSQREGTIGTGNAGEFYSHDKTWKVISAAEVTNTPSGDISAITIQAAINELDTEKLPSTSVVEWESAGVTPQIDPSRLKLLAGSEEKVLTTDASAMIATNAITTTTLGLLENVSSNIKVQLDAKEETINKTKDQDLSKLKIYGPDEIHSVELSTLTEEIISFIFPDSNGTSGQVLSKGASGALVWRTIPAAAVTSVNGEDGVVTLTTDEVPEGVVNKYYTEANVLATPITAPDLASDLAIAEGESLQTALGKLQRQLNDRQVKIEEGNPGEYYSHDKSWQPLTALAIANTSSATIDATNAQAAINELETKKLDATDFNSSVLGSVLAGLSTLSTDLIADTTDTLITALGKLQAQITHYQSSKLGKTGGAFTEGTIKGVPKPLNNRQLANKAYVDDIVINTASVTNLQAPYDYSPICPANYISVPAIGYYPGPSFCVMKWEAKTGSGVIAATTTHAGAPVHSIIRENARAACRLIGPGHDLLSNAQWQTIARNIADQAANWSSGSAYLGELNRGHSDSAPFSVQAADSNDDNACVHTGQACSGTPISGWHSQKRTHVLSNGEVIWDFAGNVWEWLTDINATVQGPNDYISKMTSGNEKIRFGNDQLCESPTSSPFCGMGKGELGFASGAMLRGGSYLNGIGAGVFAAYLAEPAETVRDNFGFRCVYVP